MKSMLKVGCAVALASTMAVAACAQDGPPAPPEGPMAAAWSPGPGGMRGMRGPGRAGFGGGLDAGGRGGGMFALRAADENGDRSIERAEFDDLTAEMFAYRDRNGDGFIDEDDASPLARRLAALREEDGRRPGPRAGRIHDRADADEDGRLSRAEVLDVEGALFARLDADSSGVVTPDELDVQLEARRNRGRWWRER